MLLKPGDNPVIEPLGSGKCCFAGIELGEGDLAVGVDESLLVDAPDALVVPT